MVNPLVIIGIIGFTALIGYLGNIIFEKTKIPDVIWLLLFGFLVAWLGFVPSNGFMPIVPIVATVAIVMLSFDTGLYTNFYDFVKQFPRTFLLAILAVFFSALSVAAIGYFLMGLDWILSLLLGFILSSVSSTFTVRAFVQNINARKDVKLFIEYESVLSDIFAIIFSVFFIALAVHSDGGIPFLTVGTSLGVGLGIGLLGGILWLIVLSKIKGKPFDYMITLGMAFLLFFISEILSGGSGIMAAIFYGLVLGNGARLGKLFRLFRIEKEYTISPFLKKFNSEASFFIRAFFFVLLGILALGLLGQQYIMYGIILSAAIILVRLAAVELAMFRKPLQKAEKNILRSMLPRDLAPIVLVQLAVGAGLASASNWSGIIFVVIIITTVYATVGTFVFSYKGSSKMKDEKYQYEYKNE